MPLLRLETSAPIDGTRAAALAADLRRAAAAALGKPERYMMVVIAPPPAAMTLGEEADPCALVEVRSAGDVPAATAARLAEAVAPPVAAALGVAPARVYTVTAGVPRSHFAIGDRPLG